MKKKKAQKMFAACCAKFDSVRLEKYTSTWGKHPGDSYQVVVDCLSRDAVMFAAELADARQIAKRHGCKVTVDGATNDSVELTLWRGLS
jgi:hypothetical protein